MPPQTPGPMPAFDPEIQAVWDEIGAPPATIQEARDQAVPVPPELLTADGLFTVEDRALPDLGISLLIIRPVRAQAPTGALYWIHGGGMFAGDNRSGVVGEALVAAREFNLAVVSVEYRLAPEHPHPAPVEDCYAGLVWTAGHAAELNIDAGRIICAGGSAGGGLAAAVTLLARDRGGPALLGQMLLCPMLDDRNDTVSARQVTDTGTWTRSSNETGWTALLGSGRPTRTPPRPGPPTCPGCRPPTSTSARRRCSATRTWPTPRPSGRPVGQPSCTSGPEVSTATRCWHPAPAWPATRWPRVTPGCGGFSSPAAVREGRGGAGGRGGAP